MKKLLIFGIGGFVGAYLANEFQAHGYVVHGSDMVDVSLPDVAFFKADLLQSRDVERVICDIRPDMIINLAAVSSVKATWENPQLAFSVNVVGALNIMEAARKLESNPKIMLIGSSEEYEESDRPLDELSPLDANNPYGISKMAQEGMAELYRKRYGMRIYYVRPFNHTGIGQKDSFALPAFCRQTAEIERTGVPGVIRVGNLAVKRDFSDVRDIVRAYRMIIESDDCAEVYNVGSGEAHSLSELLEYIVSLCPLNVSIEVDPDRFRPTDTPYICCDYSKIKEKLGWEPRHSIFETLKELYEFYLNI